MHWKAIGLRVALPMGMLFAVAIVVHFLWEADGFFLNLATELIGIMVVVLYVDWTLRRHETERWHPADQRIRSRLEILLTSVMSAIRHGLGIGPEIIGDVGTDVRRMHLRAIRAGEDIVAPAATERLRSLTVEEWRHLAGQLRVMHQGVVHFVSIFSARLSPEVLSHLLDIEQALQRSMTYYSTFPEVFGVDADPPSGIRTPPEELAEVGIQDTASELRSAIRSAASASRAYGE